MKTEFIFSLPAILQHRPTVIRAAFLLIPRILLAVRDWMGGLRKSRLVSSKCKTSCGSYSQSDAVFRGA
ncbi:hypothetical protein Plhal703r1_c06g0032221 [Plasmopara halstedii]